MKLATISLSACLAALAILGSGCPSPQQPVALPPAPPAISSPEELVAVASLEVFGKRGGALSARSGQLVQTLAEVPKAERACETTGGSTTCCGGNTEGEKSDGVCCTFGGWSISCEIVTCGADGHCYDHEG